MTPERREDGWEALADIIHEARCGPVMWRGDEHVPWADDHREWDIATAKAMLLLGVSLVAARGEPPEPGRPAIDVERLARALMAVGIVKWDDKVGMHASYDTVAEAIAAEYDRLRP